MNPKATNSAAAPTNDHNVTPAQATTQVGRATANNPASPAEKQSSRGQSRSNLAAADRTRALKAVLVIGLLLVLSCSSIALGKWVETGWGKVAIAKVTFLSAENVPMEAKVYRPKWVDKNHPAPGILALHGYQADKESTKGFGAVELARRGFVVVAFDHYGHGRSSGHGVAPKLLSGAPSALQYLESLPFVERDKIGVFGHSTGSIFALQLAKTHPQVKAIVALSGEGGNPDIKQVKNYLLVQGNQEEIGPYREKTFPLSSLAKHPARLAAFNLPAGSELQWNHTYGKFADGSARRAALVSGTHLGVMLSPSSNREVVQWFNQALRGGKQDQHWVPAGQTIYLYQELFNGIGLFALLFTLVPLTGLLLPSLRIARASRADRLPAQSVKAGVGRRQDLWIFLLVSIVVSIPLYMWCTQFGGGKEPLAAASNWFPLQMGNGIIYWLLAMTAVSALKLGLDLWVRKAYSWRQLDQVLGLSGKAAAGQADFSSAARAVTAASRTEPEVNMVAPTVGVEPAGAASLAAVPGVLGRLRGLGFVLAILGFLIVCVGGIYLLTDADVRIIWPFFSVLTKERLLILPQYFLLIMLFFVVVNGLSATFTFFRHSRVGITATSAGLPTMGRAGFWQYYGYMSLFAVGGLVLLWLFHFLPLLTGQGPGMDLVGLPNYGGRWMMMIFVLVPQFLVMTGIYCWFQVKTRSVWVASAITAAIFTWVLVGGQVGAF